MERTQGILETGLRLALLGRLHPNVQRGSERPRHLEERLDGHVARIGLDPRNGRRAHLERCGEARSFARFFLRKESMNLRVGLMPSSS